jgi:hypothetical protein
MAKTTMTPWHKVVRLREDVRNNELSLAQFAADLYDVHMGRARAIYQDPKEFFALTYPTYSLRELAKDVTLRLAGKSEKAIRSLKLTYGGGKTHSLVTLHHLHVDPAGLPDLPAVEEFVQHAGTRPPKSRVVVLAFDKLDVEKGMEVRAPDGATRWLKHPWSVLAWQIAGAEGLRMLRDDGSDGERESAPAENLLRDLVALPTKRDEATLVLMDEVLMYVRNKVLQDAGWRGRLVDFFQCLTQAITKTDRTALVASILDTDLGHKKDELGGALAQELHVVFHRQGEEDVEPVGKEDVAEVLRRRFFTPESIKDRERFRPHVVAALQGIKDLDDATRKDPKAAEERFLRAFPFHPDLSEVLYGKWTQLGGFQPTRGVLRTFALALRDGEKWDQSPLIGPNVFLSTPLNNELCPAARELATIAQRDEYEGRQHEWVAILRGELDRVREIQGTFPTLKGRELEQAVVATFLHSQPVGQKGGLRDLLVLVGATRPDRIELEKALRRWTEESWFLDEGVLYQDRPQGGSAPELPKHWRLGTKPNLNQMHRDARARVPADMIETKLEDEIRKLKSLTLGAGPGGAGAHVHVLPDKPSKIEDDGEFHFAILGPKAASDAGKPNAEARRFLEEKTGPQNPRVRKNLVVLVAPSTDGIELARERVRDYIAWEEVRSLPEAKGFDDLRKELLDQNTSDARRRIQDAIAQAYCIAVIQAEDGATQAYKVTIGDEGLFAAVKKDRRLRVQDTAISADALLPGGPYDLWKPGETARRVRDLADAFAQDPRLPKMLRRSEIVETLKLGAREGQIVLRITRPDASRFSVWRADAPDVDLQDPSVEVVLLDSAELTEIPAALLAPEGLPGLWPSATGTITVQGVSGFFDGAHSVTVKRNGYSESLRVPKAPRAVVESAIGEAVRSGLVWITSGPASIFREEIPPGVLTDAAVLNPPPQPVAPADLLPPALPTAWKDDLTTAASLATALSQKRGQVLPWAVVRDGIDGALRARVLERTVDSGPWPTEWSGAQTVRLRQPRELPPPPPPPPGPKSYRAESELSVGEIQNLGEHIADLQSAAAGLNLRVVVRVELTPTTDVAEEQLQKVTGVLGDVSKKLTLA